ncbi:hypothetical protein D3C81_2156720 [compost metagenome]
MEGWLSVPRRESGVSRLEGTAGKDSLATTHGCVAGSKPGRASGRLGRAEYEESDIRLCKKKKAPSQVPF